jgi:hypothetical protein
MSEKEEAATGESKEGQGSLGDLEDLGKPADSSTATFTEPDSLPPDISDTLVKRRSRLSTSWAALQYVGSISRDNYVRLRVSDRLTSVSLLLATILALISLVFHPLARIRLPLAFICDALVGVMILLYLLNRLGILVILSPREALLTWQLIVVSCVFGIFLTVNIGLFIAILVLNPTLFTTL